MPVKSEFSAMLGDELRDGLRDCIIPIKPLEKCGDRDLLTEHVALLERRNVLMDSRIRLVDRGEMDDRIRRCHLDSIP